MAAKKKAVKGKSEKKQIKKLIKAPKGKTLSKPKKPAKKVSVSLKKAIAASPKKAANTAIQPAAKSC